MTYVKYEVPEDFNNQILEFIKKVVENRGKVKKGVNETTKAVERKIAKLTIIAKDVNPPEIVAHLPELCEEKETPYTYVESKEKLGEMVGIKKPASSVAIIEIPKDLMEEYDQIIERINSLKKGE